MAENQKADVIERVGYTQSKLIRFNKTWVIENYTPRSVYESPIFSIGRSGSLYWRFKLDGAESWDSWPFLLLFPSNVFEMTVKPTYSLLNAKGEKVITLPTESFQKTESATEITTYPTSRGVNVFQRIDIIGAANGRSSNGKLTLFCDIELLTTCSEFDLFAEFSMTPMPRCDLGDDFGNLLRTYKFSDFTIDVGENKFLVHKAVLSARSRVFEAMFEHDMAEKQKNRTNITDIEPEVFKEMIRFIYTDKALNLDKMADKLLLAADKYDLRRLKFICEEAIKLTVENAGDMLILGDTYNANHLKKRAANFISGSSLLQFLKTEGFQRLVECRPAAMADLLRAVVINDL